MRVSTGQPWSRPCARRRACARSLWRFAASTSGTPRPASDSWQAAYFRGRLEALLAATTFAECRAPVAISVFDVLSRRTCVVTEGALAPAIQASCTVPLLFHPCGPVSTTARRRHRQSRRRARPRARRAHAPPPPRLAQPVAGQGRSLVDIPERDGLLSLVVRGVPRVGPFRLEVGPRAFEIAYRGAREALGAKAHGGVVHVG